MADVGNSTSAAPAPAPRQPNRLQRRAPASIQICPVTERNTAIPLLSPLVQSPTTSENPTVEIRPCSNNSKESAAATAAEKPVVVMQKWQHPAAPFSYEAAPFLPFVHIGVSDR